MMDMREFQEKLEQLMELAAKQEQNLNNEQILEIFGLNQLSPQQLQSLYEYLRIQGIRIQGADLAPYGYRKGTGSAGRTGGREEACDSGSRG